MFDYTTKIIIEPNKLTIIIYFTMSEKEPMTGSNNRFSESDVEFSALVQSTLCLEQIKRNSEVYDTKNIGYHLKKKNISRIAHARNIRSKNYAMSRNNQRSQ